MQLSQLENKMLQFLNSDFKEFTQQEQDKQSNSEETINKNENVQRQMRVHSFDDKQTRQPISALFQQLLQNKTLKSKTQKRQQIKIDPKSIQLSINLTICVSELPVIKKIMEKNEWKKAFNFDGDILWAGADNVQNAKQFTQDFAMVFLKQHISRLPGLRQIATKRETTLIMRKMKEYFPSVYNFYPQAYSLPDELQEFLIDYEASPKLYIAKPDKGTQGQGIFLVNKVEDLFTNGVLEAQYCKKNYIVQEYITKPLLLDNKKFDFRLYVLITSVNPLVAYLNEEGLARLCTENYEEVSDENLSNIYMHLTNYSLNKNSQKFVTHSKEFLKMNSGTKRTYTSAKKTLQEMGVDIPKLKLKIEQTIVRFLYGIVPHLQNSQRDLYQDKWQQAKCFHVIGFDILVDSNLKPWIIEINANPSLEITTTSINDKGIKKIEVNQLDCYVKSKVLEDAFIITVKSVQDQIETIGRGKYLNSFKMICDGQSPIENLDLFQRLRELYGNLCGLRYGGLNQMRFSRLSNNPFLTNELLLKSDYDLIYKRIQLKSNTIDLNFNSFIEAIEVIAEKLLKKKATNYSIQKAVIWVINMAFKTPTRPQTAKRL